MYVQKKWQWGAGLVSCDLVGRFQHLHEEGVYGRVSDQLEEEEVLQTLQTDGAQRWEAQ